MSLGTAHATEDDIHSARYRDDINNRTARWGQRALPGKFLSERAPFQMDQFLNSSGEFHNLLGG